MSVLNQMLRDLENRGVAPDLVAAAGTATVARPVLPTQQQTTHAPRLWIWAGVIAVAAAFFGVHTWLSYRVKDAGATRSPLGARQFGSVVTPEAPATPASVVAPVRPTAVVAPVQAPATPAAAVSTQQVAKSNLAPLRPARATAAPRAQPAATPANGAVPIQAEADAPVAPAVVARSNSDVERDVDRAADLIARGRANEAMELLVQVLNRQPTHAGARSSLAALLAEAGRREPALHVLLAGSEVDAGRFAIPAAQLQAEMGDLNGALLTLARVPLARRDASYEALHAGLAQRAGDHMTAITAYRRALLQPKPDAVWWVGLGVSLEATGAPMEARSAYTSAIADAKLSADVRRYVADRLTELEMQSQRSEASRRAAMANVF